MEMKRFFWFNFKWRHGVLNYSQYCDAMFVTLAVLSSVDGELSRSSFFLEMVVELISLGIQTSGIGYATLNNMPLIMSTRSLWVTRLIWMKANGFVLLFKSLCYVMS